MNKKLLRSSVLLLLLIYLLIIMTGLILPKIISSDKLPLFVIITILTLFIVILGATIRHFLYKLLGEKNK